MAQARIPFVPNQESGLERLAGGMPAAMNVVLDAKGAVRRRPGIATSSLAPSSVIDSGGLVGLYSTVGGKLFAVGGSTEPRSIYRLSATDSFELSGGGGATDLQGTGRPVFAETDALLVIAGGSVPQKIVLADDSSDRLAGGPPSSSHVIANSSRLSMNHVADDFPGRISYSSTAFASDVYTGHEQWGVGNGTAGFYTAESRPDPVVALHENTNEVFAFGTRTLQVFSPDSQVVYAPLPAREYGIGAAYSVVRVDHSFAWIDHRRRIVVSDGRSVQVLSQGIQQDLDDMSSVSDAFGYRVHHGHLDLLVWTFPTDGRTYVYQAGGGWSQWSGWDSGSNNWKRFVVNCHYQRPVGAQNLVGTTDGKVGELKQSASDDLGDTIVSRVTTGFLDRGTDRRKHCVSVRLVLERGQTSNTSEGMLLLRYRDDMGDWVGPMEVGLGTSGDFEAVVEMRGLGVYRRREWRFDFSGSDDLVLASATEEFEVLDN